MFALAVRQYTCEGRPYPRSVTEFNGGIFFFPLYQARKYVLVSWYCTSFLCSFILSHGVLFFISVLRHYPRFAHPCYRNVVSHVACRGLPAQVMYVRHCVCGHAGADDQHKRCTCGVVSSSACLACGRGRPAQVLHVRHTLTVFL
jgi:hypothetical protein